MPLYLHAAIDLSFDVIIRVSFSEGCNISHFLFPLGWLQLKGFFHQGVMRMSVCYEEDSDCSEPKDFAKYVLGYHFTEGTAGNESAPEGTWCTFQTVHAQSPSVLHCSGPHVSISLYRPGECVCLESCLCRVLDWTR